MARIRKPLDAWLERVNPEQGGLHRTLYAFAAQLREEGHTAGEIFETMRKACDDSIERRVPDREISQAIEYDRRRATGEATPGVAWPGVFMEWRNEVLREYRVDPATLKAEMPDLRYGTHDYLCMLYRQTDLLCIGKTAYEFRTIRLGEIPRESRDLHLCEFINPSPMSAVAGVTMTGEWSQHTKANTGPRVYGVIEFDSGEAIEHAAFHRFLATKLPLVMLVLSGGKSLHGWYKTSHVSEAQVEEFYKMAVMLGADPKMFSVCQFSRLPMGRNARTGKTQRVIRFRPGRAYYK